MRCEDALNLLNARADGELRDGKLLDGGATDLDAHLAECASCKAAAEGFQTIDSELRRAFGPRREGAARLAERTVAMMRATANNAPTPIAPQVAPAHAWAWGQSLFGLAAGFLLAVAVFRPWQSPPAAPLGLPALENVARLESASGPVEVRAMNDTPTYACPTGSSIAQDSVVSTGPDSLCELSLKDGNAVRLGCNSQVTLRRPDVLEVIRGRILTCSEPGRKGFEVQSGGGTFVAKDAAQLAIDCQPQGVRMIVVDGEVNVQTGQTSTRVDAGNQVRIVHGKVESGPERCDPLLETAWVNSLLALNNNEHPELSERVNRLLANVGAAKLSLLYEDELRRLGDDGVAPLLAYLASTRETPSVAQRATAARIVADVAQPRWIADLIGLLTDANADVRMYAAQGLERLTGRNQGIVAQTWQTGPWPTCEGPHQNWLRWWEANRDRYPGARQDIPPHASPPF